jgi:hypothetical protein
MPFALRVFMLCPFLSLRGRSTGTPPPLADTYGPDDVGEIVTTLLGRRPSETGSHVPTTFDKRAWDVRGCDGCDGEAEYTYTALTPSRGRPQAGCLVHSTAMPI